MGIGFVLISVICFVQIGRYKNDSDYAKKLSMNNDERTQFLATKSRSNTFYYSILFERDCTSNWNGSMQPINYLMVTYFFLKSKY